MSFTAEQLSHFRTLDSIRAPRITRAFALMLLIGIIGTSLFMVFAPWVQTAQGTGTVIALDPRDRVQNITALVSGTVERWYVTDGDIVKKGDPIAMVVDNDPRYLDRLREQRSQAQAEIAAARGSSSRR